MSRPTTAQVLNKVFASDSQEKIVEIAQTTSNPTLQNLLFPTQRYDKEYVDDNSIVTNDVPATYVGDKGLPPVANRQSSTGGYTYWLSPKGTREQTDFGDYFKYREKGLTGNEIQDLMTKAQNYTLMANRSIDITNEIEFSKYLTFGVSSRKIVTDWTHPENLEYLPFYSFTRSGSGSSFIGYNSNKAWFSAGGAVNADATVELDLLDAMEYMVANFYGVPRNIIMNTNTYKAIRGNTRFQTDFASAPWAPVDIRDFLGSGKTVPIDGLSEWTQPIGSFGAKLWLYDGYVTVQTSAGSTTTIKIIPDYYVIITPAKIGSRLVGPNMYNKRPVRYVKSKKIDDEFFEYSDYQILMGETSSCVPNNRSVTIDRQWRSHYVMYVKAL